jgi:hypothetical protein
MHDLSEEKLLETLQQLRQVVSLLPKCSLSAAIDGKLEAARAIANEAAVEPIFIDMWAEDKTRESLLAFVQQTLTHGEQIYANKKKPDDREAILAGDDFGVVFMPPELLRQLWALGEAVVHYQDKTGEAARVEPRAINVMMLAANWVKDARTRWGLDDRVEKVDIAPLVKLPLEAPF